MYVYTIFNNLVLGHSSQKGSISKENLKGKKLGLIFFSCLPYYMQTYRLRDATLNAARKRRDKTSRQILKG